MAHKYVTHNAGGGGDGTSGDPWTIVEAVANATAGDYVWIKNTGTYNLAAALTIAGTGSVADNTHIRFIGYHTTMSESTLVSDMDYGQANYGGAINPSASNAWVTFDGNAAEINLLYTSASKHNIHFRNIHFLNTAAFTVMSHVGSVNGWSFINCKFTTGYRVYNQTSVYMFGLLLLDCYISSVSAAFSGGTASGLAVIGCNIIQGSGGILCGTGSCIIGNIISGGSRCVECLGIPFIVMNNVFYNYTDVGVRTNVATGVLIEFNNIYIPAAVDDYAVNTISAKGSCTFTDFSYAYCAAGNFTVNPFNDSTNAIDIKGVNSVKDTNPQLVNAGTDYKLKTTSPCLNRGLKFLDGFPNIGYWLRQQNIACRLAGRK